MWALSVASAVLVASLAAALGDETSLLQVKDAGTALAEDSNAGQRAQIYTGFVEDPSLNFNSRLHPTYKVHPERYLTEGNDLIVADMNLTRAGWMCDKIKSCVGFTYEGSAIHDDDNEAEATKIRKVHLKSKFKHYAGAGWTMYEKMKVVEHEGVRQLVTAHRQPAGFQCFQETYLAEGNDIFVSKINPSRAPEVCQRFNVEFRRCISLLSPNGDARTRARRSGICQLQYTPTNRAAAANTGETFRPCVGWTFEPKFTDDEKDDAGHGPLFKDMPTLAAWEGKNPMNGFDKETNVYFKYRQQIGASAYWASCVNTQLIEQVYMDGRDNLSPTNRANLDRGNAIKRWNPEWLEEYQSQDLTAEDGQTLSEQDLEQDIPTGYLAPGAHAPGQYPGNRDDGFYPAPTPAPPAVTTATTSSTPHARLDRHIPDDVCNDACREKVEECAEHIFHTRDVDGDERLTKDEFIRVSEWLIKLQFENVILNMSEVRSRYEAVWETNFCINFDDDDDAEEDCKNGLTAVTRRDFTTYVVNNLLDINRFGIQGQNGKNVGRDRTLDDICTEMLRQAIRARWRVTHPDDYTQGLRNADNYTRHIGAGGNVQSRFPNVTDPRQELDQTTNEPPTGTDNDDEADSEDHTNPYHGQTQAGKRWAAHVDDTDLPPNWNDAYGTQSDLAQPYNPEKDPNLPGHHKDPWVVAAEYYTTTTTTKTPTTTTHTSTTTTTTTTTTTVTATTGECGYGAGGHQCLWSNFGKFCCGSGRCQNTVAGKFQTASCVCDDGYSGTYCDEWTKPLDEIGADGNQTICKAGDGSAGCYKPAYELTSADKQAFMDCDEEDQGLSSCKVTTKNDALSIKDGTSHRRRGVGSANNFDGRVAPTPAPTPADDDVDDLNA